VRPVLRQEPRAALRFHHPGADGRGGAVRTRRALKGRAGRRFAFLQQDHRRDDPVSQYEARIRAFLDENFPPAEQGVLHAADASLLESGVIDSMGVLLLVTWLEQDFGFVVDDDEVLPDNL